MATDGIRQITDGLQRKTGASDPVLAVRRVLTRLLASSGQDTPPYRVRPLLDILGVEFMYAAPSSQNSEASVRMVDGKLYLQIDRERMRGSKRWRFSIAHEFIHLVLIKVLGEDVVRLAHSDKATYDFVERLCDSGASHLLVPRHHLLSRLRQLDWKAGTFQTVAGDCDVSFEAAFRTANDLLPSGGVFLLSRFRAGSKSKLQLRVRQCSTFNKEMPDRPWVPFGCGPKHFGLSEEALLDGLQRRSLMPMRIVTAGIGWEVDGVVLPWPHQANTKLQLNELTPNRTRHAPDDPDGVAIVCAKRGHLDPTLVRVEEKA